MRTILLFFIVLLSNLSYSQTRLDSLLFDRINQYRDSLGIEKLTWDQNVFEASKHHSTYILARNYTDKDTNYHHFLSHKEDQDIDSFIEIKNMVERVIFYIQKDYKKTIIENAHLTPERNKYTVYYNNKFNKVSVDQKSNEKQIVENIFNDWKKSESHNKNMIKKDVLYGACSVLSKPILEQEKKDYGGTKVLILSEYQIYSAVFNAYQ